MSRRKRFKSNKTKPRHEPGRPPGSLDSGEGTPSKFSVIAYNEHEAKTLHPESLSDVQVLESQYEVIWLDIIGVEDVGMLEEFGRLFGIHPLSLEDVSNVHQRAKFDNYETYSYFVTRMASRNSHLQSEQLSIFHQGKFIITFQEVAGDCLAPLRKRILTGQGYIRKRPADYLLYALVDTVLDHYFPIVDQIGEQLDELDGHLIESNKNFDLAQVHQIRSELLELGRWIRPNREMINQLLRDETSTMSKETQVFMRDCYDHVVRLYESIETYREVCSDLRAYHLSVVSNRTNDVMKTLTIVSSIFIPLGFVAGLYGMNFQHMPELQWRYGYFFVLALMIAIASGLLFWFKRKGWFDD